MNYLKALISHYEYTIVPTALISHYEYEYEITNAPTVIINIFLLISKAARPLSLLSVMTRKIV